MTKRLAFDVDDKVLNKMDEVRRRTGAKDYAELVRWSLALYDHLTEIEREYGLIIIEAGDMGKKELVLYPEDRG